MTERIPCCVPFCRRTFKREPGAGLMVDGVFCEYSKDVICGPHHRLADEVLRKIMRRYWRMWKKRGSATANEARALDRLWHRARRQSIERAMSAEAR